MLLNLLRLKGSGRGFHLNPLTHHRTCQIKKHATQAWIFQILIIFLSLSHSYFFTRSPLSYLTIQLITFMKCAFDAYTLGTKNNVLKLILKLNVSTQIE